MCDRTSIRAKWFNLNCYEARIMPQNCQIIGVNSVTNIELGKGVMPAPIVRNADWFENLAQARINVRFLVHIS